MLVRAGDGKRRCGEGLVAVRAVGGRGGDCRGRSGKVLGVEAVERREAECVAGHLDWKRTDLHLDR